MKWISVEENLPYRSDEDWNCVLINLKNKKENFSFTLMALYNSKHKSWHEYACCDDHICSSIPYLETNGFKVTHWMPLPETPNDND